MRRKIYIETTVVSYFAAKPSRDLVIAARQEATRQLWPTLLSEFDTYISALVYQEARRGNPVRARRRAEATESFTMVHVDDEARALAERLVAGGAIPKEHPEDALHVALAAVNGIQVLVTWNFAHINNPFTRLLIREIIENEGYIPPEICSPDELLEST